MCVQQTVLDLLAAGFQVYVAVDAVASRFALDRETALRRMEMSGATLTTTEAALFEWCEVAGTPEFKHDQCPGARIPAGERFAAIEVNVNNSDRANACNRVLALLHCASSAVPVSYRVDAPLCK